jgi:macrolide transport system ATP-binding/permease protein
MTSKGTFQTYESSVRAANGKNCDTSLEGVSVEYADLKNYCTYDGLLFTEVKNKEKKKVAAFGKIVIKKLYGNENFNPADRYVKINRMNFSSHKSSAI